jgi:ankyrin repeat protein
MVFPGYSQQVQTDYSGISDMDEQLIISADKGDTTAVLKLIAGGASVNATTFEGVTALMYAAQSGNTNLVRILMEHGADVNMKPFNGQSALISAIRGGHLPTSEYMIRHGADINLADNNRVTPLMHAIAVDSFYLPDMLLYYGAEIHARDDKGIDALMLASQYGNYETVVSLLERGSDVNVADSDGNTPLHYATTAGNTDVMELLIANGVLLERKNSEGYTPLAIAVAMGNYNASRMLIGYGADVNSTVNRSVNVMNLAQNARNESLITLLKNHEAVGLHRPGFNRFSFGSGYSFNKDDSRLDFSLGMDEQKYRLMTRIGFGFRPKAIQVLVQENENEYYQFWEKRSCFYLSLEKAFFVQHFGKSFSTGAFAGLGGMLTFGSYKGSSRNPDTRMRINPKIGCLFEYDFVRLKFSYEYLNLKLEEYPDKWFNISLEFLINRQKHGNGIPTLNWL